MNVELSKPWVWLPGMRTLPERRTGRVFRAVADDGREPLRFVQESGPRGFGWGLNIHHGRGGAAVFGYMSFDPEDTNEVAEPDLNDPATIGCIEHGLLPALGADGSLWRSQTGWHYGAHGQSWGSGETKGEALVVTLENIERGGA